MGGLLSSAGKALTGFLGASDAATTQTEAMGMPPTPGQEALGTASDVLNLGKAGMEIAQPGPAPNKAWGEALIPGGKLGLGMLGEHLMPGGGSTMVGMALDQAKAMGDVMLPGGTAGAVGGLWNSLTGLGGGTEEAHEATASPEAHPAPAPVLPTPGSPTGTTPAPTPSPPAEAPPLFPNSPLGNDADVLERLSH